MKTCIFNILIIVLFMANVTTQASNYVSCDEIVSAMEDGYLRLMFEEGENQLLNGLPGETVQHKAQEIVRERCANKKFPQIYLNSTTAKDLSHIYHSSLQFTGFAQGVFYFQSAPDSLDISYLPEFIALEYEWMVQKALRIEDINPSEQEAEIIANQVNQIKEFVLDFALRKFPNEPASEITGYVDLFMYTFEKGPKSVLNLSAKRKLRETQMLDMLKCFQERFNSNDWKPDRDVLPKHVIITKYIASLTRCMHDQFKKNYPSFVEPELSPHLVQMQKQYRNQISKLSDL